MAALDYWLCAGAIMDLVLILFLRKVFMQHRWFEIITILGVVFCACPFIAFYLILQQNEPGR